MSWISPGTDRETVMATLPGMAGHFERLYASLWQQPHIPARTLELCRLRLAQLHSSASDWQREELDLPTEHRAALRDYTGNTAFSPAEKCCLEFAEIYAMDSQMISDEQADAVKAHYGDSGLVALIEALGIFDGMTRLSLLWELSPPPRGEK